VGGKELFIFFRVRNDERRVFPRPSLSRTFAFPISQRDFYDGAIERRWRGGKGLIFGRSSYESEEEEEANKFANEIRKSWNRTERKGKKLHSFTLKGETFQETMPEETRGKARTTSSQFPVQINNH